MRVNYLQETKQYFKLVLSVMMILFKIIHNRKVLPLYWQYVTYHGIFCLALAKKVGKKYATNNITCLQTKHIASTNSKFGSMYTNYATASAELKAATRVPDTAQTLPAGWHPRA